MTAPAEHEHNTYMTYLMTSSDGSTWTKLIDIKDFPDLGSAPPSLDITTLSDSMHRYINDIQDTGGSLQFTANYTYAGFSALKAVEGVEKHYAVWFGAEVVSSSLTPTGVYGQFTFKGELSVWKKGAGVGAVQEMGIAIAPTTEITPSAATPQS